MINFQRENESFVTRLRVRGEGLEPVSARLNLERLLSAGELAPGSMPAKAIVCVRKITDPLPHALCLTDRGSQSSAAWRAAVAREIENQYRRAFRPIREAVPASAESVVFADRAEFLACLAIDFCAGALAEKWWWRAIFPHPGEAAKAARIWLASAEYVPPALNILAKKGAAVNFVQKLSAREVAEIISKVVRLFGLRKLETVLLATNEATAAFDVDNYARRLIDRKISTPEESRRRAVEIRVKSLLPDVKVEHLDARRQIFAETILLLARAPFVVRSEEFAERAGIILNEESFERGRRQTGAIVQQSAENKARSSRQRNIDQAEKALPNPAIWKKAKKSRTETVVSSEKIENDALVSPRTVNKEKSTEPEKASPFRGNENAEKERAKAIISFEDFVPNETERPAQNQSFRLVAPPAKEAEPRKEEDFFEHENENVYVFRTRYGGLFYLLNLVLHLELYADFTEANSDEIELPIWDFVALAGLEMIGREFESDPIREFLTLAAGRRADDGFGGDFAKFRDWRVPPRWLKTFSPHGKWLYRTTKKRLVVRHEAGFNVFDIAMSKSPASQTARELKSYEECFAKIVKADRSTSRDLKSRKWIANFAEFLEKRLFQALHVQSVEELNRILFERSATVEMSATHLEITFSLADLPFEVRAAGIDRDPGWIPAAGRFVYFHYV